MSQIPSPPDDLMLMRRVQAGDLDAFAALFLRYRRPLLGVAESRLGQREWAEDVVQETFLAAFKSRHTFQLSGNFRTWLWTILLNQCRRYYRQRMRTGAAFALQEPPASSEEAQLRDLLVSLEPLPPEQVMARERRALLDQVLNQLPTTQADALRLRFFGGLKFREIADALECSLLTAKNRVRSGLLKMAEKIPAHSLPLSATVDEKDA